MIPRITIAYSHFLDPIFLKAYLVDHPEHAPLTNDELMAYIGHVCANWKKEEEVIVNGMREALGLDFYANAIDVHIVRALRGGFSSPLVLSALIPKEVFTDALTHELIHILITESTQALDIREIFSRLYNVPERLVRNHILVHATHEYVYKDILRSPERYDADIAKSVRNPAYKQAWDIVTERGYKNILAEFRKEYAG